MPRRKRDALADALQSNRDLRNELHALKNSAPGVRDLADARREADDAIARAKRLEDLSQASIGLIKAGVRFAAALLDSGKVAR